MSNKKIGSKYLHPAINKALELQEEKGGIFVDKIEGDVKIEIKTYSGSTYVLTRRGGKYYLQGGMYLPEEKEVHFNGSTFGGSMIRMKYIGYTMHLEVFVIEMNKPLTTSSIMSAEVFGGDYHYKMEWEDDEGEGKETKQKPFNAFQGVD